MNENRDRISDMPRRCRILTENEGATIKGKMIDFDGMRGWMIDFGGMRGLVGGPWLMSCIVFNVITVWTDDKSSMSSWNT
jgi:hypothetical protein